MLKYREKKSAKKKQMKARRQAFNYECKWVACLFKMLQCTIYSDDEFVCVRVGHHVEIILFFHFSRFVLIFILFSFSSSACLEFHVVPYYFCVYLHSKLLLEVIHAVWPIFLLLLLPLLTSNIVAYIVFIVIMPFAFQTYKFIQNRERESARGRENHLQDVRAYVRNSDVRKLLKRRRGIENISKQQPYTKHII